MTRPLGVGSSSPSPASTRSGRHFRPTAGRGSAQDCRNQSITEFFKPVLKQDLGHRDRSVLCSSDTGNVKDAGIELSVLHAGCFEKQTTPAKKVRRKKMPDPTPKTSPILDAFWKGIEKKGTVNLLEDNAVCKAPGSAWPRVVIRKLFVTAASPRNMLAEKDKGVKPEQGRSEKYLDVTRTLQSCENSWEQKTDCMDTEETSSDSDGWVLAEADSWKAGARNNSNANSTSLCHSSGLLLKLPCTPPDSKFRLALGTLHRGGKQKTRRTKQSKAHHLKPFSRTSVSHQGNGYSRKISRSASREAASGDPSQPKQDSKHDVSSPNSLRMSPEKAASVWKSQSAPLVGRRAQMSSGKRKRTVMSVYANSSNQCEEASSSDPALRRSSATGKNQRSALVKNIVLKSPCVDALQLVEAAALPRRDSPHSEECLDSSHENEKNNCSSGGLASCSAQRRNENSRVSVVDTKENQLQVANSHFYLDVSLPSQEKSALLPSPHHVKQTNTVLTKDVKSHLQNAVFSQVIPKRCTLNRADGISPSSTSSRTEEKALEDVSDFCPVEGSKKLTVLEESDKRVQCSLPFKQGCEDNDCVSSELSELKVGSTRTEMCHMNGKSKSSFDSEDETLECILDDDDDDETFIPLQEILSSSGRPQTEALEGDSFDDLLKGTTALTNHLSKPPVGTQVSYVNSLEHLLKEKEQSKRLGELEKRLREDVQRKEIDSSDGENENAVENGDLSEEHRAFIKRFSVVAHAIPDYHPGEDVFDLSISGKIFNQHDLDLRNFHFIPQNPMEKLLLSSDVTQQLFLAVHGFLSSYSCSVCPIPILKWLFQMMSVHPSYCVSTQILDKLIEITLNNASISDEQSKPWIPSLADVTTVFVNMGIMFRSLFPLQHLQPNFNERDILSQRQGTVSKEQPGGFADSASPAFFCLPESNLMNVIKFLDFCTTVIQDGYTDQEILLLLLLLFKISLDKQLKQVSLIDFQCLLTKLLISIKDWDTKMPELCLGVSELSSQHHNLLWLVQLVPSWITRGREVRRRLSLVIIAKLLNKKHTRIPDDCDQQMSLLHQYLVYMKPSNLLEKMRKDEQQNVSEEHIKEHINTELEQEVYYLIYILLHLVSEASFFDTVNADQRQHLLKFCSTLDKHIKCDIREDARLFYRTKVKDLVARIYGRWQDLIQNSRLTQGKLHDFWEPDS
ncbi:SMC5-SMC6 complex localization factor protein 2 isoform X2 [Centrocercus urophasianus]|uniref:SMC5-SMC6 complex localization factor protein 2 isoform X2 n=1 Tax=Centrocercus urophasianus TaxID=9002 RepID=UPI001C64E14E|nr:SMC5-SMC6 complex localization factor protein 2 isoform X2 [Centrocercus urophasianus]